MSRKTKERINNWSLLFLPLIIVTTFMIWLSSQEKQHTVEWAKEVKTEGVIQLPDNPYNCKLLKAVVGKDLNYCELAVERPILPNRNMVMGDYTPSINRIRVTQETSNDSKVHEFLHQTISCYQKYKENELCVLSAQKMMLELKLI